MIVIEAFRCMGHRGDLTIMCMQVVVVPGRIFHVEGSDPAFKCPYARLAFCNVSDENLWEGAKRLGAVLRATASQNLSQEAPA
jgi:hypothetical protein